MRRTTRTPVARSSGSANAGRASSGPHDVLLIADDPRPRSIGSGGRTGETVEQLDMETVVRKLISLLSQDPKL
jgi:hypothetical protein